MPEARRLVWLRSTRSRLVHASALLLLACGPGLTEGDRRALDSARREFERVFELQPLRDTYLLATHRAQGCPARADAERLYRAVFFAGEGVPRPGTHLVYLNLQDRGGRFCYQLFWDPAVARMSVSNQAFY